jgi:hypothetical protein
MLAKLTSKNQLTLPVDLLRQLPRVEYFEATLDGGAIVLRPVQVIPAVDLERVREALVEAGVREDEVVNAVAWARRPRA